MNAKAPLSLYDKEIMTRSINTLHGKDLFEVRIFEGKTSQSSKWSNFSGYFNSTEQLFTELDHLHLQRYKAVCITLNSINPALIARSANKLKIAESTTSDRDVICRKWLFIDLDPKRPSDVSSSDEERRNACCLASKIIEDLSTNFGFPEPILSDSGNGYHLLYRIDLPSESDLPRNFLDALSERYSNQDIEVDRTVYNAARLIKLCGTLACKGDSHQDSGRVHRMSTIVSLPKDLVLLDADKISAFIENNPHFYNSTNSTKISVESARALSDPNRLDLCNLDKMVHEHFDKFEVKPYKTDKNYGYIWPLGICPFDSNHKNSSSIFFNNEIFGFKCHHASCVKYRWNDVSRLLELPDTFRCLDDWPDIIDAGDQACVTKPPRDIWEQEYLNDLQQEIALSICLTEETVLLLIAAIIGLSLGKNFSASAKSGIFARQNIYSLMFMGSGERKSTLYKILISPVEKWINQRFVSYQKECQQKSMLKQRIEKLNTKLVTCKIQSQEEQTLNKRIEGHKEELASLKMKNPSILVEEGSMEGHREHMMTTGGILGVFSDEGRSILQVLMGLYSKGETRESDIIKAKDGTSPIRWNRTSGTYQIDNPCMSIGIMVQLDWIKKLIEEDSLFESGFFNRFFICIPEELAGKRDSNGNLVRAFNANTVSQNLLDEFEYLITNNLNKYIGDMLSDSEGTVQNIPFTSAALTKWVEYYNRNEGQLSGLNSKEKSLAQRYASKVISIAIIRAAISARELKEISEDDIAAGIRFVEHYRQHDRRLLGYYDCDKSNLSKRILKQIKERKLECFSARDMQNKIGNARIEAVVKALNELCELGYIRPKEPAQIASNKLGRHKSAEYDVNPKYIAV